MDPHKLITVATTLVVERDGDEVRLPVVSGTVTAKALDDGTADYILDVDVAREHKGKDLTPAGPEDLLSCAASTAFIEWKLSTSGAHELHRSPRYTLEAYEVAGDTISLSGHGQLSRVWEHVDARPTQVSTVMTSRDVLMQTLSSDRVPVVLRPGVPVRRLPAGWVASTNRLETVVSLLEAMPGVLRENYYGAILAPVPAEVETYELELTDGDGGTVVSVPHEWERSWRPNHVIVRGVNSGGGPDFVAEAVDNDGLFAPSRHGWVSVEIENDSVTSLAQAQTVAVNELWKRRRYSRVLTVRCVTDWRLELDAPVRVSAMGQSWLGRVVGVEMPVSGLGEMSVEVGVD